MTDPSRVMVIPADTRRFLIPALVSRTIVPVFDQRYRMWDGSDLVTNNHAFDSAAFHRNAFDL